MINPPATARTLRKFRLDTSCFDSTGFGIVGFVGKEGVPAGFPTVPTGVETAGLPIGVEGGLAIGVEVRGFEGTGVEGLGIEGAGVVEG